MSLRYKAKHILLEDLEDAFELRDKILAGDSFEQVAIEFSECDSGIKGGMLGRFSSGTMDAAFEKALYHLKIGELSKPVKTKYGYHLIVRIE
jgi:parvulin-like peptidyl-prolyl isomerase